jgi:hypothetical protein
MAHHHGHHHEQEQMLRRQAILQWRQAMQAEYERLYAMSLPDLAAEVMARAFGSGGQNGYDDAAITVGYQNSGAGPTHYHISERFVPEFDFGWEERQGEDRILREQIERLVAEGLQVLEHASLVRCQIHHEMGAFDWTATRYGRAMLDQGQIQAVLRPR